MRTKLFFLNILLVLSHLACSDKQFSCTTSVDCSARMLFLTSRFGLSGATYVTPLDSDTTFNFASVKDADKACAAEASSAGIKPYFPQGTFMAFLAEGSDTVLNRFASHILLDDSRAIYQPGNASSAPLLTYEGSVLDLIQNMPHTVPFSRNASGAPVDVNSIGFWSGLGGVNCASWASSGGSDFVGEVGNRTKPEEWAAVGSLPCNHQSMLLLCIEVDQ